MEFPYVSAYWEWIGMKPVLMLEFRYTFAPSYFKPKRSFKGMLQVIVI